MFTIPGPRSVTEYVGSLLKIPMRAFEIAQLKTTTFHTELHSEFKVVHFSPTQIQQNKKPQKLSAFQV